MKTTIVTTQLMTNGNLTAGNETITGMAENSVEIKLLGEAKMNQKSVEIKEIKFDETEIFDTKLVQELVVSIRAVGLLNPIIITPDFQLVAGRLRLEAYKTIGYETIPASIVTLGEMQQRLATIDENLIRKVLTKLEEAEQLSERKKIYEALYPETRRGVAGALAKHGGATDKMSFAADTASKTGQTERNVNRKIAIYERLYPEVRELVRNSAIADNLSELIRLCDYDFETQIEFAGMIQAGKAKTIAGVNRLVDAPFLFANTDKGKFQKSVKLAEKALNQLIEGGVVENFVEGISEENYVFFKEDVLTDLESLKNLQERVQVAIRIFENGIRKLEANTFVCSDNNQELALAE